MNQPELLLDTIKCPYYQQHSKISSTPIIVITLIVIVLVGSIISVGLSASGSKIIVIGLLTAALMLAGVVMRDLGVFTTTITRDQIDIHSRSSFWHCTIERSEIAQYLTGSGNGGGYGLRFSWGGKRRFFCNSDGPYLVFVLRNGSEVAVSVANTDEMLKVLGSEQADA
jgi:hypothetical protein